MGLEIERKFLVTAKPRFGRKGVRVVQGYLCRDKKRTVRVRLAAGRAFLTIKGTTRGAARPEFEYEVPAKDGRSLLRLCERPFIEKTRRIVVFKGFSWEVDEFSGANAGLVIAEIELDRADETFEKPTWAGREVTADARYSNASLVARPYETWRKGSRGRTSS